MIISKTHEDFTSYHFQHIKELSNGSLKFGLANLDERYFYSSIFSYTQSIFKIKYFDLNLINIPIYLFYLSLIGYLFIEIFNTRKSYLCSIVLALIILKFKRLSEFGYDYIGQFILIYLFIEYVWKTNINSALHNSKLILIFASSVLIKITNLYFSPVILFYLLFKNNLKNIFNYKIIILPIVMIFFTFSGNSFLKTGCFNYLIKQSCISSEKYKWVLDYDKIEIHKKLTKNWTRGFFHQKKNIYTEEEYNNNFKWINNWFFSHFINKISPFIALLIFIILFLRFLVFKKKLNTNRDFYLFVSVITSLLIWLLNFPQFRFGFASFIIISLIMTDGIIGDSINFNKKKLLIILSFFLIYFNISNINRISKEFHRDDLYKFKNFPWFAQFKLKYEKDYSKDFIYQRSLKSDFFWRSCFNAEYTCINHDDDINFKISNRIIFINKF